MKKNTHGGLIGALILIVKTWGITSREDYDGGGSKLNETSGRRRYFGQRKKKSLGREKGSAEEGTQKT